MTDCGYMSRRTGSSVRTFSTSVRTPDFLCRHGTAGATSTTASRRTTKTSCHVSVSSNPKDWMLTCGKSMIFQKNANTTITSTLYLHFFRNKFWFIKKNAIFEAMRIFDYIFRKMSANSTIRNWQVVPFQMMDGRRQYAGWFCECLRTAHRHCAGC